MQFYRDGDAPGAPRLQPDAGPRAAALPDTMFDAFGLIGALLREAYWVTETVFWQPAPTDPGRIIRSGRIQNTEDGLFDRRPDPDALIEAAAAGTATLPSAIWRFLPLLVRNSGRVMTHRHLSTSVRGPAHAADVQYLRVYIGQSRQKLGPSGALLRTEPDVGYRLVAAEAYRPAA